MSRARPKYEPRRLECRECGAPLEVPDDRTRMLVCSHCHTALSLTGLEQEVLVRHAGEADGMGYRLDLRERLQIDGASYEVIARVCVIDAGQPEYKTQQYYLYNPRREAYWLSDYRDSWDLTRRTRVRPLTDPFGFDRLETHDGRSWVHLERGTQEVYHVDGALPFVMRVGDHSEVRELRGTRDRAARYEVARTENELEYNEGRAVERREVEQWLGRKLPLPRHIRLSAERRGQLFKPFFLGIALTGALMAGLFGAALFSDDDSGRRAGTFTPPTAALAGNAMSEPIAFSDDDDIVRIRLSAPLSNAWMYAQIALVEADADTVVHVSDAEMSFYSGRDSEGTWTEGSPAADVFFRIEEGGNYRVMLGATSGLGEMSSNEALHPLSATVFHHASYHGFAAYGLGALAFFTFPALFVLMLMSGTARTEGQAKVIGRRSVAIYAVGVLGIGAVTGVGCAQGWTAPDIEHPEGISIRQSSAPNQPRASFFRVYDSPRRHLGGGVHSGK